MIAVQSLTGAWYRRIRDETDSLASYIPGIYPEELDPPAGYTVEFYQEYLQRQNLPSYFLAPGHIAMRQNNEEAEALGIVDQVNERLSAHPLFANGVPRNMLCIG
ncbi:hypothetical protein LTR16_000558 [Cryomyces antarcticus]|uniref:Uncharacterized protein n=1 Tax=Cryomyces antarcticus TaxID=329879 RepID=A0ABR0M8U3_9PEZI|nr:hypothetical protein LTR16_000558 [Cryomyces antarcticus]